MTRIYLLCLALVIVWNVSTAVKKPLSFSMDQGNTWSPLSLPLKETSTSTHAHLRHGSDALSSTLYVPRCALEDALRVSVVREKEGGKVLGLRWVAAKGCGGRWKQRSSANLLVAEEAAMHLTPDWVPYLKKRTRDGEEATTSEDKGTKEKGFFGKYGLYLMGFAIFALARGIQKGLAELSEELEREEAEKLKQKKPTGQVRVAVPRKKQSTKSQRKAKSSQRTTSTKKH